MTDRTSPVNSLPIAVLLALVGLPAPALGNPPEGCDELPVITLPVRYDVSFEGDIRPRLEDSAQGCTSCHGSFGNLSLSFANARVNLLGVNETGAPSSGDASILRIRPFEPLASSLFLKVNCEIPPFGSRMPLGGSPDAELQALIHDWIAVGALMPDAPGAVRLFIGNFESIQREQP